MNREEYDALAAEIVFPRVTITDEQAQNLDKLQHYLESLPLHYGKFEMERYLHVPSNWNLDDFPEYVQRRVRGMMAYETRRVLESPEFADVMVNDCGTTACAIGHGPSAGIPALKDENWRDYEERVFGLSSFDSRENVSCWLTIFGHDREDDPKLCASRIRAFLYAQRVHADEGDNDGL